MFLVNVLNKGNGAKLWAGPNITLEEHTPAKKKKKKNLEKNQYKGLGFLQTSKWAILWTEST